MDPLPVIILADEHNINNTTNIKYFCHCYCYRSLLQPLLLQLLVLGLLLLLLLDAGIVVLVNISSASVIEMIDEVK